MGSNRNYSFIQSMFFCDIKNLRARWVPGSQWSQWLHPWSSGKREYLPYIFVHEQQSLILDEYFLQQNQWRNFSVILIINIISILATWNWRRVALVEDRFKSIGFLIQTISVLTSFFGILISRKGLPMLETYLFSLKDLSKYQERYFFSFINFNFILGVN